MGDTRTTSGQKPLETATARKSKLRRILRTFLLSLTSSKTRGDQKTPEIKTPRASFFRSLLTHTINLPVLFLFSFSVSSRIYKFYFLNFFFQYLC